MMMKRLTLGASTLEGDSSMLRVQYPRLMPDTKQCLRSGDYAISE